MPKLSDDECTAFLNEEGVIMHVATVDENNAPLVAPIWYLFEDGKIYFTPRQFSEWLTHIRSNPNVALSITEAPAPYRKVVVRGKAVIENDLDDDETWRDIYMRISTRYITQEAADTYVANTDDQTRALLSVSLADAEVRTWRMPVDDEAYKGIWASRYYTEDAKINKYAKDGVKGQPSLG